MGFVEEFDHVSTELGSVRGPAPTISSTRDLQLNPPSTPPESSLTKSQKHISTVFRRRQWLVWKVGGLLILHALYLILLVIAFAVSLHNHGLVTIRNWQYVHTGNSSFYDQISLTWTTLPTLIFSILLLHMRWCYEEIQRLLPYLQLYKGRDKGHTSVLVNYRSEFPLIAIFSAWMRSHRMVSFTITLSLIFSIVAVPLSSHLFETRLRQQPTEAEVSGQTVWNSGNMNERTDYSRALQVASVLDVYKSNGGIFSQWASSDYAFPSYSAAGTPWGDNSTIRITDIEGHGGRIENLKFLNESQYRLSRGNGTDNIALSGTDDGCLLSLGFDLAEKEVDLYFQIGVASCSRSGDGSSDLGPSVSQSYSKMFFFLGWPAPGSNATAMSTEVITGDPVHVGVKGDIEVAVRENVVSVKSFKASNESETNAGTTTPFDRAILQSGNTKSTFSNIQTTYFGGLILDRFDVARRNASTPWVSVDASTAQALRKDMMDAIGKIYTTVYVSAAALNGFEPVEWPLDYLSTGVYIVHDVERLFINEGIAGFLVGVLIISFLIAGRSLNYALAFRNYQVDCPEDLISSFDLLHGCNSLGHMADDVHSSGQYKGDFVETARKRWNLGKATFSISRDESSGRPTLQVENLNPNI
ncbi:unnamed protein product [Clonostachys rosea]|uniref:Uncharacterized protein n=1 Tax=Bionectria ochroleuca TaxID=29856 RepID=A0ABY6U8K1_BIOOC|nr:unnamed protein product [Clonostachys rosea]